MMMQDTFDYVGLPWQEMCLLPSSFPELTTLYLSRLINFSSFAKLSVMPRWPHSACVCLCAHTFPIPLPFTCLVSSVMDISLLTLMFSFVRLRCLSIQSCVGKYRGMALDSGEMGTLMLALLAACPKLEDFEIIHCRGFATFCRNVKGVEVRWCKREEVGEGGGSGWICGAFHSPILPPF